MKVISYNAGNASTAKVATDYANLAALKPDVIGSQEVTDRAHILAHVPGYTLIQLHDAPNSAHVALNVRADLKATNVQLVTINRRSFVGRLVAGARRTGYTKAKPLLSAVIEDHRVGVTHLIPSVTKRLAFRARRVFRKQVAGCVAFFNHGGDVLVMDGNAPPSFRLFAPLRKVADPYAAGISHGIRRDIVWVRKGAASTVTVTLPFGGYSSDHKPVVADITWATKPVPNPVPVPPEQPVTQTLAVDYSVARPDPKMLAAKGFVAAGRYLAGGTSDKWLTATERDALHAAGLGIFLVYESVANRAAAGHSAGVADARAAAASAKALGLPDSCPLFFAVDFDATPAQVAPYFAGVKAVLGSRAGDYGGIKITEANLTGWHWQTAAWSGGIVSPQAHIYQRVKPTRPVPGTDENVICKPFPLWTAAQPSTVIKVRPPRTRGLRVDVAIRNLRHTLGKGPRAKKIAVALKTLLSIRPWHKKG